MLYLFHWIFTHLWVAAKVHRWIEAASPQSPSVKCGRFMLWHNCSIHQNIHVHFCIVYRGCQSLHCLPQELNWPSYEHRNICTSAGIPKRGPSQSWSPEWPFEVPGRANSQLIKVPHLAKRLQFLHCEGQCPSGGTDSPRNTHISVSRHIPRHQNGIKIASKNDIITFISDQRWIDGSEGQVRLGVVFQGLERIWSVPRCYPNVGKQWHGHDRRWFMIRDSWKREIHGSFCMSNMDMPHMPWIFPMISHVLISSTPNFLSFPSPMVDLFTFLASAGKEATPFKKTCRWRTWSRTAGFSLNGGFPYIHLSSCIYLLNMPITWGYYQIYENHIS